MNKMEEQAKNPNPKKIKSLRKIFMPQSRSLPTPEATTGVRSIITGETNLGYINNQISTRRYNWWTFLPISILFQFRKLSNCYFLASAAVMLIPEISPLSPMSAIGPLIFVVAASELREFLEELGASKRDKRANLALVDKMGTPVATQDLHPGDMVKIRKDEAIPADLLLLASGTSDGTAFVETANLDGETNLKIRRGPSMIKSCSIAELKGFRISFQLPSADMYSFKGVVETPESCEVGISENLNLGHVLLRGCTLRNTEWIVGVVIYSGHDTKMLMNARSGITPSKVTSVDTQMNRNVISLFGIQMVLCIVSSAIGIGKPGTNGDATWYFSGLDSVRWISLFLTYFILLNTIIPASLWVSVEILKFIQAYFMEADASIRCNSKNTHEELGQVTHVFSDKTGTLTVNKMKFVGCSVVGKMYLVSEDVGDLGDVGAVLPFPGVLPPSPDLMRILREAGSPADSHEHQLFLALSLCHTCERITDPSGNSSSNQSSSPDEAALVSVAAECGFEFKGRPEPTKIQVGEKLFDLVHQIPFTSDRRMMTVVVRHGARIVAYSKGADSSLLPKCLASVAVVAETRQAVACFSAHGFRTLCVAKREFDELEWAEVSARLEVARRAGETDLVNLEIEAGMELVGSTAVEDRLQDGVPETLRALKAGGIKVCMITGDKRETAINIARSCGLISTKKSVFTMLSHSHMFGGGQFVPLRSLQDLHATQSDPLAREVWEMATGDMGLTVNGASSSACIPPILGRQVTQPDHPAILSGKFSMVIDGVSLSSICASPASSQQLVDVLTFEQCEAVVFCRVSPKQKGEIVQLVQAGLIKKGGSTLAIGDGANDINMINIANVGVGIAGNEGAQAANSADYSITQFSDLHQLLFFHGRLNYSRTTTFISIFMYKNFLFTLCQFWFATVSLFSGQTVFDDAYVLLYNSIFCFVPLFLTGVIDKDIDTRRVTGFLEDHAVAREDTRDAEVSAVAVPTNAYWFEVVVPLIFKSTPRFTEWSVLKWCLIGTLQSLSVFYICWLQWQYTSAAIDEGGMLGSLWMGSLLSYTAQIFIVSIVNMMVTSDWTKLFLWSILVFNFGLYFVFVFIYNLVYFRSADYMGGIATGTMGNLQFWLTLGLIIAIAVLPLVGLYRMKERLGPDDWKREIQRRRERRSEPKSGPNHS